MLELSTLVFKVDTDQLTDAIKKTNELSAAQKGLATAMTKGGSGGTQAGTALRKNVDSISLALERQSTKMKILRGESVSLADGISKLDRVFTAGQAAQLASLKLSGAGIEQYNQLAKSLQDFTKISGANPFDNTASGLAKMRNEVQELHRVNELASKGFKLTRDEVRLLQRDINSNTQSLKNAGATSEEINKSNSAIQSLFIKEAKLRNELVAVSKEQERQSKNEAATAIESSLLQQKSSEQLFKNRINFINEEIISREKLRKEFRDFYDEQEKKARQSSTSLYKSPEQPMDKARVLYYKELDKQSKEVARANKFLATEMQRVDAVFAEMNNQFGLNVSTGERSAAMVAKYSTALQRAGVSGVEAAAKLETYRAKVQQIAMQDGKRAATRLSRALTPQISDVAVSVAGGMPLHLVIMQQGLQIRDLIAQSGVAAQTLQGVFKTAAADMVKSIGGTIAALGSLTFGAIADAGVAVSNFALKWSGLGLVLDGVVKKFPALAGGISLATGALGVLTGGLLVGAVAGIGALVYEYAKLIGANNELARSLAVTGGVFGVAKSESVRYVDALTKVGASTRESITILGAMSDAGNLTKEQLLLVGASAVQMQKYAGIAITDTIKSFSEMAKDPVKALTELAIKTGDVSPALLRTVRELAEQGQASEASALAVSGLGDVMAKQSKRMQEDLHPLTVAAKGFLHALSEGWTNLGNVINRAMGALPQQANILNKIVGLEAMRDSVMNSGGSAEALSQIQSQLNAENEKLEALRSRGQMESDQQKKQSDAAKQMLNADEIRLKYADKQYKLGQALQELSLKGATLSKAEYAETEKRIRKSFKEKPSVNREAAKQKSYELNIQEKINDAYNQMVAKAKELNPLEKALLDIRDDPRYKGAPEKKKQEIEEEIRLKLKLIQPELDALKIKKRQKEAEEDLIKARKELVELSRKESKHGSDYEKRIAQVQDLNFRGAISDEDFQKTLNAQMEFSNAKKSSDEFERKFKEERDRLALAQADLDFENSMIGRTEKTRQYGQIQLDLKKKFIDIEADYRRQVEEINLKQEGEFRQKSLDEAKRVSDERKALATGESQLKVKLMSEEAQRQKNFDDVMKRGFESMGDALIDFAVTGKSSFGDMIKQMLIDLAKLEMRMQMMKLYEGFKGGGGGSGGFGNLLGNVFRGTPFGGGFTDVGGMGSAASSALQDIFGGFFANGGNPPIGKASIVGENGPELIVPRSSTTVIPNHQLGGNKKVFNMNQTYNIQIDSRSDQASVYAGVRSMLEQNNAQLIDSLQTGGHLV